MLFLFHHIFFPFRPISVFMGQLGGYICIGFQKEALFQEHRSKHR